MNEPMHGIGDVVAVFEVTQDLLDRIAERDREEERDEALERAAVGFYWQRYAAREDGTSIVDAQAGPFPVYSAAFESAALERANAGLNIEDWRDRAPEDLAPAASTETVEHDGFTVDGGPADGVVPLHDQDGTVLEDFEGAPDAGTAAPPSAEQGWPFEARVSDGTGEPMDAIEAPADGTPTTLEQPGGDQVPVGGEVVQLPVGVAVDQDGNLRWTEWASDAHEPGSLVEDADGAPLPPVSDPAFPAALDQVVAVLALEVETDEEPDDPEADAAADAEQEALDRAAELEASNQTSPGGEG